MKPFYFLLVIGSLTIANLTLAQGSWIKKADFPGEKRAQASSFQIDGKLYVGLGIGELNGVRTFPTDFWCYDPASDAWSKKADFPGQGRFHAVAFSIGNKGFVGTGSRGVFDLTYLRDFWQYDPGTDAWTQKTDFGGSARTFASGFSLGGRGFIGTGSNGSLLKDFWSYDPGTNTWTKKADFAGGARTNATAFSIGNKAYLGTGFMNGWVNDFWEYDAVTDTWNKKAAIPATGREWATGFTIGKKGYLGTGFDGNYFKDFWEYDQALDAWTKATDFGGGVRNGAIGVSNGTYGFVGTGYSGFGWTNDFWQYKPGNLPGPGAVTNFTLVNALTGEDLQPIPDETTIFLNSLPTNKLNIRANTSPAKVGSVVFRLDGKQVRIENGAPYAFAGDLLRDNIIRWSFLWEHTL